MSGLSPRELLESDVDTLNTVIEFLQEREKRRR